MAQGANLSMTGMAGLKPYRESPEGSARGFVVD